MSEEYGLFGRCQDPLTRERVLYEVSVPVLQRLQEVLKQLMMQGLSWQDDITQYIISQEMARVPRVYSSPSPKEAAVDNAAGRGQQAVNIRLSVMAVTRRGGKQGDDRERHRAIERLALRVGEVQNCRKEIHHLQESMNWEKQNYDSLQAQAIQNSMLDQNLPESCNNLQNRIQQDEFKSQAFAEGESYSQGSAGVPEGLPCCEQLLTINIQLNQEMIIAGRESGAEPFREQQKKLALLLKTLIQRQLLTMSVVSSQLERVPLTVCCFDHERGQFSAGAGASDRVLLCLCSALLVDKQPPQVIKTQSKFSTTVRFLLGERMNSGKPAVVKAQIITESQARGLSQPGSLTTFEMTDNFPALSLTVSWCLNLSQVISFPIVVIVHGSQDNNALATILWDCAFSEMDRIPFVVPDRVSWQQMCDTLNTKFMSEVQTPRRLDNDNFRFLAQKIFDEPDISGDFQNRMVSWSQFNKVISFPIVVIVHGSQDNNALATILWDCAFSEMDRIPFVVPDRVSWQQMCDTLNTKFMSEVQTPRRLDNDNFRFLAQKIFDEPDISGDFQNRMVSWSQFNKEVLPGRGFTFWQWFDGVMELTKRHLKNYWTDRLIFGFIGKQYLHLLLQQSEDGTFLLRFSDSEIGGITIAYVTTTDTGSRQILNIQPFTKKDLEIRSLGDRIQDITFIQFVYPNRAKNEAFNKYYTVMPNKNNGYLQATIHTKVAGEQSSSRMGNGGGAPSTPSPLPSDLDHQTQMNLQTPFNTARPFNPPTFNREPISSRMGNGGVSSAPSPLPSETPMEPPTQMNLAQINDIFFTHPVQFQHPFVNPMLYNQLPYPGGPQQDVHMQNNPPMQGVLEPFPEQGQAGAHYQ
ncbi:UNVERIFIED_CONTAM: hypothetical protein FKN15_011305 [Acipenser sinensis]